MLQDAVGKNPAAIFVFTLLAMVFTVFFSAHAQQSGKIPRIGILPPGPISERVHLWDAFRQELHELGYVEGKNIVLIFPSIEVNPEQLPRLAAELVSLKVDVIVALTTPPAVAAMNATKAIPIVVPTTIDPVGIGLVVSLARPGGNVTGLSSIASDLSGKRLELLKEVVPAASHIAVLSNPSSAVVPPQMREAQAAAKGLGLQLQPLDVRVLDDFEKVFRAATKEHANALIMLDDAFCFYSPHADRETRSKKPATRDLRIHGVC